MFLSDRDIAERLDNDDQFEIDPIADAELQIQPCSVDVRLDNTFLRFDHPNVSALNPLTNNTEEYMSKTVIEDDDVYTLHPGDFILASTIERVSIPHDIIGFVNGRSTLGRHAVVIHATAGLLDSGFVGNVTLEISNLGRVPIELTPGMRIGQLTFAQLSSPVKRPYGEERKSKYQNQTGVQSAVTDIQS